MIADGLANTEIADRLELPLGTVKTHIAEIFRRLHAADRTRAAIIALREGLL